MAWDKDRPYAPFYNRTDYCPQNFGSMDSYGNGEEYGRELPIGEWVERHNKLADLAKDVYRQVMRKEPDDGPYLISWTRVF